MYRIAADFKLELNGAPMSTITAGKLYIGLVMDEETRHSGMAERLRKLWFFDEYEFCPQKKKLGCL